MRGLLFATVLLAGCDAASIASSGDPAGAVDTKRVEAEKACAAVTGYLPGVRDKVLAGEYKACVAAVMEAKEPEMRGRTAAPD